MHGRVHYWFNILDEPLVLVSRQSRLDRSLLLDLEFRAGPEEFKKNKAFFFATLEN